MGPVRGCGRQPCAGRNLWTRVSRAGLVKCSSLHGLKGKYLNIVA